MADLTPKQARFVEEYLVDLNATQAALRAGYSQKTAAKIGSENLKKPEIQNAISEAQGRRSERTEITQDRVLQELAKLGFGDIRAIFSENGSLKRPTDMDEDAAARISSIEVVVKPVPGTQGQEVEHVAKIKLWDKLGALTQLGRHLGLFTDKVEQNGNVTFNISKDDADL
ncbi:terminase small subunit [Gluconobacter thailandicus]|uniref:Terminase small subunit n=1 Tax=Gluconobacter thailandicus TaxID=257438 RepID=A0AAP9EV54_GLUTH|nr:terminase small subunit [Gluconobacter thailandicus]QEH97297.1 terminase small subunit [Gluconobacter thailandicus]